MGGSLDSAGSNRSEEAPPRPTRDWLFPRAFVKAVTMLALAVAFLVGLVHGFAVDYVRSDQDRTRSDRGT